MSRAVAPDTVLPAGPELSPLRQASRWASDPVRFMRDLQEAHGDVFTVRLPGEEPWVMVADPDLVKQVFTASDEVLYAGEQKRMLGPILGPRSVMLTDGEPHMRARRVLLPPFHLDRVGRYEETMRTVVEGEIARWPASAPAPAAPHMNAIALEVILRTVFGIRREARLDPLRTALEELVRHVAANRRAVAAFAGASSLGGDRFVEFRELLARADELILAEIASRREEAGSDHDDVLSVLLETRYEDGEPLSAAELRDQLMTLLIAGHETVATSLAWALERLVRAPAALARVASEAENGGGPYTEATVREALRLRPPVMVAPRLVRRPFRLGGHRLPPGVVVAPSIPLVHLRPDVYPEPDAFRPERFLERQPGTYTWIPFGGGIRRCIGAGFSLLEMRAVLSTLLARVTIEAVDPEPEPPSRRLLVMAPGRGAELILRRHGS